MLNIVLRLFGATNIQIYFYFRNYTQDRIALKCTVIFLWYDFITYMMIRG